jgi:hypothetical protein
MTEDHLIQFIQVRTSADSHVNGHALLPARWKYGGNSRLRQLSGRRSCCEE